MMVRENMAKKRNSSLLNFHFPYVYYNKTNVSITLSGAKI